jgi:hypothetical protein
MVTCADVVPNPSVVKVCPIFASTLLSMATSTVPPPEMSKGPEIGSQARRGQVGVGNGEEALLAPTPAPIVHDAEDLLGIVIAFITDITGIRIEDLDVNSPV